MAELRDHVPEELGDPRRHADPRPQRLPQVGNRVVRRGPAVVRPSRQARELPDRRLPGLRAPGGYAPLDRQLYLPEDVGADAERRRKCHVPEAVVFKETWRIGLGLLERCRKDFPHAWVSGDDEMGRPARFRAWLRQNGERYVLDVPCNTTVRDLRCRRPRRRRPGRGRKREVPFCRADAWAARQPESRLDPADGPRRRAGAVAGRRDGRAGAGQGGAAGRAGGAAGGDADGRGEAPDRITR